MPHSKGCRRGTRYLFAREFHTHGYVPLSTFMQVYRKGDLVSIKVPIDSRPHLTSLLFRYFDKDVSCTCLSASDLISIIILNVECLLENGCDQICSSKLLTTARTVAPFDAFLKILISRFSNGQKWIVIICLLIHFCMENFYLGTLWFHGVLKC